MLPSKLFYLRSITPPEQNNIEWLAVYNATPCYFFSFSNEGLITRINDIFLSDIGFTRQEVLGIKRVEDLLTVGSKIFFQTHLYPLIRMQRKADEIFLSFLTKEKNHLPVLLNVALYESGDAFEIHCGGLQISQRNKFEQELLEARKIAEKALDDNVELVQTRNQLEISQRNLELQLRNLSGLSIDQAEMSKVLSHDIQEPIRKISIFSSKLLYYEQADLSQNSLDALKKIISFAEKAQQMLSDLEKFNSLASKNIRFTSIDLLQAIETAKNYSGLILNKTEINFIDKAFVDNPDKTFISDYKLIIKLLNELIKNSVKFKNPDAEILEINIVADIISDNVFVTLEDKYKYDDCLRITFSDNGIQSRYSRNAFELFNRSHLIKDEIGTELAYCRRIVQLLNGKIKLMSMNDKGAVFEIILPLKSG